MSVAEYEARPKYSQDEKFDIISKLMEDAKQKYNSDNDALREEFNTYHSRFIAGEVSPEELEKYNGHWLKALKEKDRSTKNNIIEGEGSFLRRNEIAVLNCRPFTDLGNAERIVDQYGTLIKYIHPFNSWYVWTPSEGRWKKDVDGYCYRIAKDVVRRIPTEAQRAPTKEMMKAGYGWAFTCENRAHLAGMIELAQNDKRVIVAPDDMDANDYLFNLKNGTFNLKTLELQEHKKSDNISRLAPFEYQPNATCPEFLKYLDRIFRNRGDAKQDTISFLQRAVGYTLTGSTQEQCLFILYGSGANGKSVFLDILNALMGEYGTVTQSKSFTTDHGEINNDIAALAGKRLVYASENSSETKLDESLIKQLTGGENVSARFLHQEFFVFSPKFKLWWAFNHPPAISDMTNSIWRRLKIVPFDEVLPESEWDRKLAERLKTTELSGIFNWAIQGLKDYYKFGLNPPKIVTKATSDYKMDQDILHDFINEYCEIPEENEPWGKRNTIKASELYGAYKIWNSYNGEEKPMSSTKFGRLLRDKGFSKDRTKDGNYYSGIRLKSDKLN